MRTSDVYVGAALLGVLAGMRSMAGPAVLGRLLKAGVLDGAKGPLALVSKPGIGVATGIMTLGEMVADKLPIAPNRTAAGPLLGRAVLGGVAGAALFQAQRRSAMAGGLIGAAAAVGAAYAAFEIRKQAVRRLGWRDGLVALAEDAVVAGLGLALTSRLKARS